MKDKIIEQENLGLTLNGYGDLVVQELTAEQEDYIIESGLEMIREQREGFD